MNCCTGKSDAMAAMGFCGGSTLSIVAEIGKMDWLGFSRNIQVEGGIRYEGDLCMGGA